MLLQAGKSVGNVCHWQYKTEHWDRCAGRTSLVREDDGHVEIASNFPGIVAAIGPTWPNSRCPRPL